MKTKVIYFPDKRSYYRKEIDRIYEEYCQNKKERGAQRRQELGFFCFGVLVGVSAAIATLMAIKFLLN